MLAPEHAASVLNHLNRICPNTFDEGEFGPWRFTGLGRSGDISTVSFDNSIGEDCVTFEYAGDCVDGPHHLIVRAWSDCINDAILRWERGAAGYDAE